MEYDSSHFLLPSLSSSSSSSSSSAPIALLLLNSRVSDPRFLEIIWKRCSAFRIIADGGAVRLYDGLSESDREKYLPDAICGDCDSITPSVQSYYEARGVSIHVDKSQDSTDMQKCLAMIRKRQDDAGSAWRVVVFGAFGGRMDQQAQNLNCLYLMRSWFHSMTLLSEDCYAFLCPVGTTRIKCVVPLEGKECGLLPLGEAVKCLGTKGLAWDVDNYATHFGSSISTSNSLEIYRHQKGKSAREICEAYLASGDSSGNSSSSSSPPSSAASDNDAAPESGQAKPFLQTVIVTTSEPILWTSSLHLGEILRYIE